MFCGGTNTQTHDLERFVVSPCAARSAAQTTIRAGGSERGKAGNATITEAWKPRDAEDCSGTASNGVLKRVTSRFAALGASQLKQPP